MAEEAGGVGGGREGERERKTLEDLEETQKEMQTERAFVCVRKTERKRDQRIKNKETDAERETQ